MKAADCKAAFHKCPGTNKGGVIEAPRRYASIAPPPRKKKKHFVPSNTNSRVGPFYVHMVGHN